MENKFFLKNTGFLFNVRAKVLISLKSNIFPVENLNQIPTPEPTPEATPERTSDPTVFESPKPTKAQTKKSKHKISLLKMQKSFQIKFENKNPDKILL